MIFKSVSRVMSVVLVACVVMGTTACGSKGNAATKPGTASASKTDSTVSSEPIPLTLGRQTLQNVKLPDGATYEDNAYTRMVTDELGYKLSDEFEANGDDYDRQVSLAISAGEIPDIMNVNTLDEVKELYDNGLIVDLTDVYDKYASDELKKTYDSYDGRALGKVTIDGQLLAIPGTNVDAGPSMVWIRADWLDKLGIKIDPEGDGTITLDELKDTAKKFMKENPGNSEHPVGLAFASWLTSGDPDGTYSINSIAYSLGALPKTWILNDDGSVSYGSLSDEMKETLQLVADWNKEGLIDPQLGTRTWDDITALLSNGDTGITFGTWHIPDWLLNNVKTMQPEAAFNAYAIADKNGKVLCKHNDAAAGFIVVSKKCEHPEAAVKIVNLFYDSLKNDQKLLEKYPEVAEYVKTGVDGSARPFNIEVNTATSLMDEYSLLKQCLDGKKDISEVNISEVKSNFESITKYKEDAENADTTAWSKYHSRCKGVDLIQKLEDDGTFNWVTPVFPSTTPTMETNQSNLDKLEEETFIKIATGAVSADKGFDEFVSEWKSQGGDTICKEIADSLNK